MVKESYRMIDALAQVNNVFTRMDARIKVVFSVVTLGTVIALSGYRLSLVVFILALAAMLAIKIPARLIMARIVPPMILGLVFFSIMVFFRGQQPLFTFQVLSFHLVGYSEGFHLGLTVLARVAASVSLLLFLSVTTPIQALGYALYWLKVPKVIVEILLLTYRYIFVLWDEGTRIREAQSLRLGYPSPRSLAGWKLVFRSTCTLMGMVFIRAYDRAESTFSAMQTRAYNGNTTSFTSTDWSQIQTQYLVSSIFVVITLLAVGI